MELPGSTNEISSSSPGLRPEERLGASDVSPCLESQGRHLNVHLSICSLVILPNPVPPSVFSLSPAYFPGISLSFFFCRDIALVFNLNK